MIYTHELRYIIGVYIYICTTYFYMRWILTLWGEGEMVWKRVLDESKQNMGLDVGLVSRVAPQLLYWWVSGCGKCRSEFGMHKGFGTPILTAWRSITPDIWSRWGNRLATGSNATRGWGSFPTGQPLNQGWTKAKMEIWLIAQVPQAPAPQVQSQQMPM